ncbi:MAG: hypothetical protein R3B84_23665 [Zavarzinella sp.]
MASPTAEDRVSLIILGLSTPFATDPVVKRWLQLQDAFKTTWEFILCQPADENQVRCDSIQDNIHVLHFPKETGAAEMLTEAVQRSQYPLVLVADAQINPTRAEVHSMFGALPLLNEITGEQVSVVSTRRRGIALPKWKKRRKYLWSIWLRIVFGYWASPPAAWYGPEYEQLKRKIRWMFSVHFFDPFSPLKLFRRTVLEKMSFQSFGPFLWAELLAKANFLGCTMDEIDLSAPLTAWQGGDVNADLWKLFRQPKFRSPIPLLVDQNAKPSPTQELAEPVPE